MMKRTFPTMLGLALALTAFSGESRAQWGYGRYPGGYGGYGWGGWGAGTTYAGSVAQGLGMFNIGAGIYNEKTAVANSINTDTVMRWNQYVYEAQKEATRQYYGRRDNQIAKNKDLFNAQVARIATNPDQRDIERGDALNVILDQLSDPRIQRSTLRSADSSIDAQLVREIPFVNASEAITISLEQIRDASKWPRRLRDPRLAPEQKEFEALVVQARKEDEEGDVSLETLDKLRAVGTRINDKLIQMPLENPAEDAEAQNFAKTILAMIRMLEKPKVEEVINELRKIDKTSVSNLLGFMHTFNLRFGVANTPEQRTAYTTLFPQMAQMRDKIYKAAELGDSSPATAAKAKPHDFFSAMKREHIEGKKENAPPPPAPQP